MISIASINPIVKNNVKKIKNNNFINLLSRIKMTKIEVSYYPNNTKIMKSLIEIEDLAIDLYESIDKKN